MEFLRNDAGRIYLSFGININRGIIIKIGQSDNIVKRAKGYESHANGSDILHNNKKGDPVDEGAQKIYFYYVVKIPLDKTHHPGNVIEFDNFFSEKPDLWFEYCSEAEEFFKKDSYDYIYTSICDTVETKVEPEELFKSYYTTKTKDLNYYINQVSDNKKAILYWRVLTKKYGDDFSLLKKHNKILYRIYDTISQEYSIDINKFGDLYLNYLTTFDKNLKSKLRNELCNKYLN